MYNVILVLISGLGLTLACTIGWAQGLYPPPKPPFLELVKDGEAKAAIVLPENPPLEMKHAADELAAYIRRMSGAEMKVVTEIPHGPAVVLRVQPPEVKRRWAGSQGYRLLTDGDKLHIIGSDALSVLFGVYGLLERHLGVRWLWPGELGEIVPEAKTVRVGQLNETSVPHFAVRCVGTGDWALRHGANVMVKIANQPVGVKWKWHFHTFCALIPAEKYFEKHPEWWPLVGGKRQKPTREYSHSTQLCTSNPEMVAEMTRNMIAALDAASDTDIIALSPNDGGGFCECPNCTALDEPGRDWFATYSKRLAVLSNAVATEVAKKHPNTLIKVGAYARYLRRPLDESLIPTKNQIIQICHIYCCHNHPILGNGCVSGKTYTPKDNFMPNQAFREIIQDWKKVTEHIFIYEYYTLGGPSGAGLPWPLVHTIREDLPYYYSVGVEGFYTQLAETMFHRYGMNYYLAAKLAWDTSLNLDALMKDYCAHAFGPAAEPMLAYFMRLEKAMTDANICISYGQEPPQKWGPKVFTAAVMSEAGAHMERALAAAPEGPYRQRVAFFKKGFDEFQEALTKMRAPAQDQPRP